MGEAVCGDCVGACDGGGLLAEGAGCCVVEGDEVVGGGVEGVCVEDCGVSLPTRGVIFTATVMYGIGDGAGLAASLSEAASDFSVSFFSSASFDFDASGPPKIEPENVGAGFCVCGAGVLVCSVARCARSGAAVVETSVASRRSLPIEL